MTSSILADSIPPSGRGLSSSSCSTRSTAHDMRLLIDIVPNHMATDRANGWWWDLLRRGRSSLYAPYFDVDWSAHGGRVLLAILAAPLRAMLERAVFEVVRAGTGRELAWDGQRAPLDPKTGGGRGAPLPKDVAGLLDRQHYRLAYWRTGRSERNYRCFFDVDSLVGVRVEDRAVYDATHELDPRSGRRPPDRRRSRRPRRRAQ